MTNEKNYDIIIAGAGASGLMAAVSAAGQGKKVLLLEQKDIPGKKILATGNGRCNFTNSRMDAGCFYGSADLFNSIYPRMDHEAVLAFFDSIGIFPKERDGYYYPNSDQAASVQKALEFKALSSGARILCQKKITDIIPGKDRFTVICGKERFFSEKLLIASGLKASPKLGSDGSLIPVIENLGHHFTPVLPSLCGFAAKGLSFKQLSGVRVRARVSLLVDGLKAAEDTGEVQLTDYGLSGIPVFQISSPASRALNEGKSCRVLLDFLPDMTQEDLRKHINARRRLFAGQTTDYLLNGLLPSALAGVLCTSCAISAGDLCSIIPERKYEKLIHLISSCPAELVRPRGFEYAQVCTGGIRTEEIDMKTLESRILPGLYFSGEILDVDGICGGYNLQWAWSSGFTAGMEMSKQ